MALNGDCFECALFRLIALHVYARWESVLPRFHEQDESALTGNVAGHNSEIGQGKSSQPLASFVKEFDAIRGIVPRAI